MYIALCGPSGAGKDTLGNLLADQQGYEHVSGGDVLRDMLRSIGLEPKKTALGPFGTFIREHYGNDVIINKVIAKAAGKNIINTGIRSPSETRLIQEKGGLVVYIDAAPDLRYERIVARSKPGDIMTLEEFKRIEAQEWNAHDDNGESLKHVRASADLIIVNNRSMNDLRTSVEIIDRLVKQRQRT